MKKEKQTRVKVDGLIECSLFFSMPLFCPPLSGLALYARPFDVEAWSRARGTRCCDFFQDRRRRMRARAILSLSISPTSTSPIFLKPKKQKKQVDRTNFQEGLSALRAALAVSDFYALDCEFTGIDTTSNGGGSRGGRGGNLAPFRPPECSALQPPTLIDEPEERYPALASSASRFAVAQVGIAVFEWVRGSGGGGSYRAHPFNCWTFVCSSSSSTSSADNAAAFQCTPGSLAFLSGAGFDFNRWIGKGIPSFSARERDELLAREEARKGGGGGGAGGGGDNGGDEAKKDQQQQQPQFQRPPIVPTAPHDVDLVEETVSRVSEWLLPSLEGEEQGGEKRPQSHFLRLRGGNAFQRALVYQTLERGEALAPLRFHPGTEDARFVAKTLWPEEEASFASEVAAAEAAAEAGQEDRDEATIRQNPEPSSLSAPDAATAAVPSPSPPSLPPQQQQQQQRPRRADIVLLRVPPGGARIAAERERWLRLERARLGSGFALFLEALRDSGLPCAVHNGAGDLAHVVASFGEGPAALLPPPKGGSSLAGFCAAVARWFPGGVFDTKVLASRAFLRGDPFGNATALRNLYEGLVVTGGGAKGANGTTGAAGAPTTEAPPPPLPLPRVPRPSLPASGPFSRYAAALRSGGSSIDGLEHEAGFDALLTGAALWGLANALGEGGQGEGNDDGSDDDGDGIGGGGGNGNNNRRRSSFPTSLPPPPSLRRPQMQRDPSPRDLVASIEAAAAASDDGGSGASALRLCSSPPPRRVRASRLPRAALGCVYAHMSDWGVLPLMEEAKRKKWGGESALFPPPRRDNVLFVVPLSPLLGGGGGNEDGGGNDVFRALHSLASREAGAGRCRVTPRLRGWAASLELFEAGMPPQQRTRPQQQQQANGEEAPRRRSVDPGEVARALASLPQLRGCRVLDYGAFREWKRRAIARAEEEARSFVDEERAAAEAAAGERAALAAALEKDAAAGVFGRRRAAPTDGDAAFPRKRSRGGEGGGEGGGGGGGGTRACVIQ